MDLNRNNDCHGNYNATCIFIQLLKKEKATPTPVDDNNQDSKKEIENNKTIKNENVKEENKKENEENINKVEENKIEIEEKIKIEDIKKRKRRNKK